LFATGVNFEILEFELEGASATPARNRATA